jgi:hypothetical protein
MRKFPIEAKYKYLQGLAGSSQVRFCGTIPHGKKNRDVVLDIDPKLILKIADAIRATGNGECRDKRYNPRPEPTIGHAVWHLDNPEMPMPCVDHSTVIDVPELLAPEPLGDLDRPLPELLAPEPLGELDRPLPSLEAGGTKCPHCSSPACDAIGPSGSDYFHCRACGHSFDADDDDDPYEGSWREAADNEGARIAHEASNDDE